MRIWTPIRDLYGFLRWGDIFLQPTNADILFFSKDYRNACLFGNDPTAWCGVDLRHTWLISESCLLLITDFFRLLLGKHAINQLLCLRLPILLHINTCVNITIFTTIYPLGCEARLHREPTGKVGIEPTTRRLTADCSTNWATCQ